MYSRDTKNSIKYFTIVVLLLAVVLPPWGVGQGEVRFLSPGDGLVPLAYDNPSGAAESTSRSVRDDAVSAKTYYVDSADGDDRNRGTTSDQPWKTLNRVNEAAFQAGDRILFRRGRVWRGMLVVPSSGVEGNPILFGAYGNGHNPVIMRSEKFSDWELYRSYESEDGTAVIWGGRIKGVRNSWGAVKVDKRVSKYRQYDKISIKNMKNGFFYSPLNKGAFYFRNDGGNPGALEIGARPEAILIMDRSNVVIDSIDGWGPGGLAKNGGSTGHSIVKVAGSSRNIIVRNLELSHGNSFGIISSSESENVTYFNLHVHDNGSTGIYANSQGGEVSNCKSYSNGKLDTDFGDRGGIGLLRAGDIRIHSNEVFNNGRSDDTADFEVSVVQAQQPIFIERNYIHDCIQGCIQIAEGGDNSVISYNIISGFGDAGGKPSSPGVWSGIRIGGGIGGARGVRIYNNIIHGGKSAPEESHAGLYLAWFDVSGNRVANNIFFDNRGKDVFVREKAKLSYSEFLNNLYYKTTEKPRWNWRGENIRDLKRWSTKSRIEKHSIVADPLFVNSSGTFSAAMDFILGMGSPCIDRGIDVGIKEDYRGWTVPSGHATDIGAYEATE